MLQTKVVAQMAETISAIRWASRREWDWEAETVGGFALGFIGVMCISLRVALRPNDRKGAGGAELGTASLVLTLAIRGFALYFVQLRIAKVKTKTRCA